MKIKMNHQAWPAGGGAVLAAGRTYDLPAKTVKQLPKGSYRPARKGKAKQQRPPRDKQATGGRNK